MQYFNMDQYKLQVYNSQVAKLATQSLALVNRFGKTNILFIGVVGFIMTQKYDYNKKSNRTTLNKPFWKFTFLQYAKPTRTVFEER